MPIQQPVTTIVRRPLPVIEGERRVRLPIGADSKLFGGWGVRF